MVVAALVVEAVSAMLPLYIPQVSPNLNNRYTNPKQIYHNQVIVGHKTDGDLDVEPMVRPLAEDHLDF